MGFSTAARGGIEVIGAYKWVMPCNWKFPAENFGGDLYHVEWSHLSAIETRLSPGTAPRTGSTVSPGNGHVVICFGPNDVCDPPVPEILDYEQQIRPEVERRLGPRSGLVTPIVGTMFPNFSMLRATSRTFCVWHPRGPEKPRSGRGFTPTKRRRHMSRKRSDWPASGALARPAPSSRTTWTIGRSARALAAAWCRGGLC